MRSTPILKSIVPAFLWSIVTRALAPSSHRIAFAPQGWATPLPAGASSQDYWSRFIAHERSACEQVIARVRAGDPIAIDVDEQLKHDAFAEVLALASRGKQRLNVLDYGANLGDYYWRATALLPGLALEYHCKELPALAAVGRQLTPAATWHTDDACVDEPHDLVMFASSLQYLQQWQEILRRAARSTRGHLFLSDVPTLRHAPSYVVTETSEGAANLHYQLNRDELIDIVEREGLRIVREYEMGAHPPIANAPEQPTCAGWLFERPVP